MEQPDQRQCPPDEFETNVIAIPPAPDRLLDSQFNIHAPDNHAVG